MHCSTEALEPMRTQQVEEQAHVVAAPRPEASRLRSESSSGKEEKESRCKYRSEAGSDSRQEGVDGSGHDSGPQNGSYVAS